MTRHITISKSMTDPFDTHKVVVCTQLDVDKILPYLRAENMVTSEEFATLKKGSDLVKYRRERLIHILSRRGSDPFLFRNFGYCLVWSGQKELARHIGVDVSAVPPCPHPDAAKGGPVNSFQTVASLFSPGAGGLPPGISEPLPPGPVYNPTSTPASQQQFVGRPQGLYHEYYQALRQQQRQPSGYSAQGQPSPHSTSYGAQVHPSSTRQQMHVSQPTEQQRHPPAPRPVVERAVSEPDGPPPKVFILYHKDPGLEQSHGITVQDFADKILDMSHILHSVGGFEVSIDMYEKADIGNWNTWTEQKIGESKYVVLVLSPGFGQALKNPEENKQLSTEKGSFFVNGIVNLIPMMPGKFIPTFLSNYEDEQLIPVSLKAVQRYTLDVDQMVEFIKADPDTQPQQYLEQVQAVLATEQFDDWRRLIHHLRGQNYEVPPPRAEPPLQIPAGPVPVHQATPDPPQNDRLIAEGDFLKIAQVVASNWKLLGMRLGLHYNNLEALGLRYPDPIAACMAMFGVWQQEAVEEPRHTLKTELQNLGFGNIASTVFRTD